MKFQDIPANTLSLRVKRTDNSADLLQEQAVFSVDANLTRTDEFDIRLKDCVVSVKPGVKADIHRLNSELAGGRTIIIGSLGTS